MIAPFILSETDQGQLERTVDLELMKCLHGNHVNLRAEIDAISSLLRWDDTDRPSVEELIEDALRGTVEEEPSRATEEPSRATEESTEELASATGDDEQAPIVSESPTSAPKSLVSPNMVKKFGVAVEHAISAGRVDDRGVVEVNGEDLLAARIGQVWLKSPKKWEDGAMYGAAATNCGYPTYTLLDPSTENRRVILAPAGIEI
jgi:hypothetical protein